MTIIYPLCQYVRCFSIFIPQVCCSTEFVCLSCDFSLDLALFKALKHGKSYRNLLAGNLFKMDTPDQRANGAKYECLLFGTLEPVIC